MEGVAEDNEFELALDDCSIGTKQCLAVYGRYASPRVMLSINFVMDGPGDHSTDSLAKKDKDAITWGKLNNINVYVFAEVVLVPCNKYH
ncbi:hypothetical protein JG687_00018385 [Phytophthora cactorum]|uniref:Uncharacterized protein n=1 Tax=Phytophthora cactorum TaxID=29920 RepID=A0A8T1TKS5_9STRA|nr:hypothetical protein JG687_00018385 [Phytophthora cactorum]